MSMDLKEFIENHRKEINNREIDAIYIDACTIFDTYDKISKLTELFYKCGIDPLNYMSEVPRYYMGASSLNTIKIPNNIERIGAYAFIKSSLKSLVIPNSVEEINEGVFKYCSSLKSILIPDSVTSIGNSAFYRCHSLETINYTGKMEQWTTIKKSIGWENMSSIRRICCLDGVITQMIK